jgi:hypothetical protein
MFFDEFGEVVESRSYSSTLARHTQHVSHKKPTDGKGKETKAKAKAHIPNKW